MKYAAVIFDVVESRRYYERFDIQRIIMYSVDYLNFIFNDEIKKPVVSSAGDEFQGLFLDLKSAFLYLRKLQMFIYPIKIRCGVGYGEIKYDLDEWMSSAIDGAAYYRARDAVNSLEGKKSNSICFNTHSEYDKYLNLFCESNMRTKSSQSQVAQLIELVADVMMPIANKNENINFYEHILDYRFQVMSQERWNRVSRRYRDEGILNLDYKKLFENKEGYTQKKDGELPFAMDDYWARGMSTEIAQIMNTTRQNIDRYVALGKIKQSRTVDKAIYEMLGSIYV